MLEVRSGREWVNGLIPESRDEWVTIGAVQEAQSESDRIKVNHQSDRFLVKAVG